MLCRAHIGLEEMNKAAERVTAHTVEGDWVEKRTTAYARPIGKSYVIPQSNLVQHPHTHYVLAAEYYGLQFGPKPHQSSAGLA